MAKRNEAKVKSHWGPDVGRVKCGARKPQKRIRTREEWDAIQLPERCNLCEEHVQRQDKPRPLGAQGLYGLHRTRARQASA